jgi:hypothetical protein
VISLTSVIWFSSLESAEAVGLNMPPTAIVRVHPSYSYKHPSNKIVPIVYKRSDKIRLMPTKEMMPLISLNAQHVHVSKKILKSLRAGDFSSNLVLIAIGEVVYIMIMSQLSSADAFAIFNQIGELNAPTVDLRFGFNPYDVSETSRPQTGLQMYEPSAMSQQDYSSLTKLERRQLADPLGRDGLIEVDGYPRLDLRYNQVEFKTLKHVSDHGLPESSNGKTPKTEANAVVLRDSLINMPNRQNIIWYKEGRYQGGTPSGCDCVNLFDPDTNIIAVYQKQLDGSNLFLTTCKLNDIERDHLIAIKGNFVTGNVFKEQKAVSTNIRDNTNNNNGLQ